MEIYLRIGAMLVLLLVLLFGAAWLELPWWVVGIGIGLVSFAFIASLPGVQFTFNVGWVSLALAACILCAAWLVARFHDIPLAEVPNDPLVYRKVRRLPGYAVAAFTFSLAAFAAAWLQRKRTPRSGKIRKS